MISTKARANGLFNGLLVKITIELPTMLSFRIGTRTQLKNVLCPPAIHLSWYTCGVNVLPSLVQVKSLAVIPCTRTTHVSCRVGNGEEMLSTSIELCKVVRKRSMMPCIVLLYDLSNKLKSEK